jgi:hypothetical protein
VANSTKSSKPTSKKRAAVALFDDKDDEDERKGDEEEVKPLPKLSNGKAVTSKKRDAVVLLDDEDDEDVRPYRKHIIGQNNMRPPLPPKLVRSPKKKEGDDPILSD